MVYLLHFVLGAVLSGINCANSPPPFSSFLSRLNYVPWKQPPAANVEWFHTKSVPQWSPHQTSEKVTCNANHLHQAKPENIESISPKNDELYPGKRRKRDGALNFAKKKSFSERENKLKKYIFSNRFEKSSHRKFRSSEEVNHTFLAEENPHRVSRSVSPPIKNLERWKDGNRSTIVALSDIYDRKVLADGVKNRFLRATGKFTHEDTPSIILSSDVSLEKLKLLKYNTVTHGVILDRPRVYSVIKETKTFHKHDFNKTQKFSKRSHGSDVGDCMEKFPRGYAKKPAVRKPWSGKSGRTTSRREALVRASLITEDRSYTLKMLPRNRVVGLTLQPGSQHRLLLPVERSYGPLSLTIAPCGDTLSWSLTRRPLPKVTETREALNREGQSPDQVDLGSQTWEGTSVYGDRGGKESLPKSEQEVENISKTRDAVLIEDQEKNFKERGHNITLKEESEMNRKENQYVGGLSENDVLYEERKHTDKQENGKIDEKTILSDKTDSEESESAEMQGSENFSLKQGNNIQGIFSERYRHKTPRQYESEIGRRTLKNIFSLKNLAFDIGKSDFYENEANRLLYRDEFDEMLRHQREKRKADWEGNFDDLNGVEKFSHSASTIADDTTIKTNVSHENDEQMIENKVHSWPTQIIFEDPIHIDWSKGSYFDQSKFISTASAQIVKKLPKSVILIPLRKYPRRLNYFQTQNNISAQASQLDQLFQRKKYNNLVVDSKLLHKRYNNKIIHEKSTPIKLPSFHFNSPSHKRNNSSTLNKKYPIPKSVNNFKYFSKSSNASDQDSVLKRQRQRSKKISEIWHSNGNKQVLASEGEKLVSNLATESSPPFRVLRSSFPDALTTSTPFQSHSNPDTNSSIASDFGRHFSTPKKITQNQMKENLFQNLGQMDRQISYSRLRREAILDAENKILPEGKYDSRFRPSGGRISAHMYSTNTVNNTAGLSLSEMISSIWNRQRHGTTISSWRRKNFSQTLPEVQLGNNGRGSNIILQNLPSGVQQVASRTIWGRVSQYDLLDSGAGDQVWSYTRANVTAGVYVLTVSSSSLLPVAIQVEARRRRAASEHGISPVTAMVSRHPMQPPMLTISWLRNAEESHENIRGIVRFSKTLRNDVNSRINKTLHSYEPLISKNTFRMDQSISETKISSTISSLQAPKSLKEIEKGSSKEGHKQYCLALSEKRQYDSLCRARTSNEPSIKLGCTRLTRYSLPLVAQQFPASRKNKRYYVTVWQSGSLLPLGQTSLRGSGRGKVPHLRQGILHKILLSAGGAATAKFRIRKNPQRLHVAAVACSGGLSITVREGGPDGRRVVEAGGRSALIVSVLHPPKGLLHLTVTPFTPHSSHTLLIAAATSAKRLPLPRLPHSLTVRADVTSCHSGIITWQSAPGRPKYCVLLEEVTGRPKITWPPIQCGWESKLAAPTTLAHCSPGYKGRRQTWQLLRLKEDTTYTITVLITHQFSNRTLSIAPTVLYTPHCS